MTIGSTIPARVSFNCDGVTKVFPIPIQAYQPSDISVILTAPLSAGGLQTTLVLNSDYSMVTAGTLQPSQWTLTTLAAAAYAAGYTLQAFINPVQSQQTNYVQGQAFPSLAVVTNFDRLTQMVQRAQDQLNRSVLAPDGDVSPGMRLPTAALRALMYLAFDVNGNVLPTAALPGTANTQASIAPLLNPRSPAEIAAGVFPTNYVYLERDVRRYGALGDNVHDDTAAFTAADSIGGPVYIYSTPAGYKVTSTITFHNDVYCTGFLNPTTAIGANNPTVVIASRGYGITPKIVGLVVAGSGALRTALINGIRCDAENAEYLMCRANTLNYGWIVRMFSNTFTKCCGNLCNTNMSAYARSIPTEVNTLTVDGGNWDSALVAAFNLGDTSWGDALPAGNFHGVEVNLIGGLNTDGAPIIADNIGSLNIKGIYMETTVSGTLIQLGGSGDGNIRNVTIGGCFLKTAKYAIKCLSGVQGLTIEPNWMTSITVSGLSMSTPLYGVVYRQQVLVGCFGAGQEFALNFGPTAIAAVVWPNFTVEKDFLYNGQQMTVSGAQTKWYPGGIAYNSINAASQQVNFSSGTCVFYNNPALNIAGTMAANVFTVTTLAQCIQFSAGDRIATNVGGYTFISSINYETGAITLQGGAGSTATTLSQTAVSINSTVLMGAIPVAGTWAQGDKVWFTAPATGTAPGAICTVAGTPGTWKNMAPLS